MISDKSERERQLLLEAIKDSCGVVSTIARRLKCDWHTAKKMIEADDEAKRAVEDETETILDEAENVINDAIREQKDIQTSKWVLATKGKKRGYTEKHELGVSGDLNIVYLDKQDEQL